MTIFAGRRAEFLFEGVDEISYAFNTRSVATFFERTGRRHEKVCGIVETKRQDVFGKRFAELRFEFPQEIKLPKMKPLLKRKAKKQAKRLRNRKAILQAKRHPKTPCRLTPKRQTAAAMLNRAKNPVLRADALQVFTAELRHSAHSRRRHLS